MITTVRVSPLACSYAVAVMSPAFRAATTSSGVMFRSSAMLSILLPPSIASRMSFAVVTSGETPPSSGSPLVSRRFGVPPKFCVVKSAGAAVVPPLPFAAVTAAGSPGAGCAAGAVGCAVVSSALTCVSRWRAVAAASASPILLASRISFCNFVASACSRVTCSALAFGSTLGGGGGLRVVIGRIIKQPPEPVQS
ncbi:hypothetical protein [Mesorhizobium sp. M9A.F.Ca.ET.002.03.1.2]|uniref:hypothetical protein n=1 Tax=Mesorhizobium sp. M9A.F.Ca.ET.002.03.1.2 TaxID=2493668 RepID=UPI001FE00AAD|nr:hypothetical protein [Mesorhizobium sp. M9A.F.Ca.ET.002.03.1.2]